MAASPWDQRYAGAGYVFGEEPNDWLAEQSARLLVGGRTVLSLGEGEGRNAAYLAKLGLQVTATDQSEVGLAKARRLAALRGVGFATLQADLRDLDMGVERWDGIVSIWCHLPSALRRVVHARVVRALKPNGWLILEAYGPGQLALGTGGPKDADMLAEEAGLKAELMGLEWHLAASKRRQVAEGQGHAGLSEVVQLVGRKPGVLEEDQHCSSRCDCV
jgi:SAM-dependent methyltransferase